MSEAVSYLLLGWFVGTGTFFSGFFLGALVYNRPEKKEKDKGST